MKGQAVFRKRPGYKAFQAMAVLVTDSAHCTSKAGVVPAVQYRFLSTSRAFSFFPIISILFSHNGTYQIVVPFSHRLEQVQHTIQIDCLPDMDLVLWLRHVIQQKLQYQGATKPSAFDFEI